MRAGIDLINYFVTPKVIVVIMIRLLYNAIIALIRFACLKILDAKKVEQKVYL